MLDMAIYKAGCAKIRLKSGINSSAKTYNIGIKGDGKKPLLLMPVIFLEHCSRK